MPQERQRERFSPEAIRDFILRRVRDAVESGREIPEQLRSLVRLLQQGEGVQDKIRKERGRTARMDRLKNLLRSIPPIGNPRQ